MLQFTLDPRGYWHSPGYRALTFKPDWAGDKVMRGWDVYALQTGLNFYTDPTRPIVEDGWFGARTLEAVTKFQKHRGLEADGAAGGQTQLTLVRSEIIPATTKKYNLPRNGVKGGVEKESGNWVGNHTAQYINGSFDAGPPQINDHAKGLPFDKIFHVPFAIDFYGQTVRKAYDTYSKNDAGRAQRLSDRGLPTTLTERRKWELAFGSWNRPAYTNWLAGEIKVNSAEPNPDQLQWIEGYIDRVTVYITDFTP